MPNMSGPTEFTPEVNEDFYNKLARGIQTQGDQQVGQARGEALSRNLTGDPFEASATAMTRANTGNQLSDLKASTQYNVAGMARDERMMNTQRGWTKEDQSFSAGEADKNRAMQERLARLGYSFQQDQSNTNFNRGMQMLPYQFAAGAGGTALGKYL